MTKTGLNILDYAVVAAFFISMIGVGVYYARRQRGSAAYFGGDKSVPWYLAGVSYYMGSFSALAFVMYSALGYKYGWLPVTLSWLNVPVVLFVTYFMAARWRRAAQASPLEFLEVRFTNRMRQALVWLGLPMRILDGALKLLAIGTVVGVGMGFPVETAIVVSGVVIVFYTFLGGLKAALVADFIQFFVLLAIVVLLPVFCLQRVGGLGNFVANAPDGFFSLFVGKYTWLYVLVFFYAQFLELSTSWSLVQRLYSTRSDRDAKKAGWLVMILLFVGPPLFFFPAMAAREFLPGVADADLNGVYALVCRSVLPAGLMGLVVAAMFSATMSTLAGFYNAISSVVTNDFYVRMLNPGASERRQMVVARLTTFLVGALVIGFTFVMRYAQGANDLFDVTNQLFGVFGNPIAVPVVVGLICRRFSRFAGFSGLVVGICAGVLAFVAGHWIPCLREMIQMNAITTGATLAGMAWGTWWRPDTPDERKAKDAFFRRLTVGSLALVAAVSAVASEPAEIPDRPHPRLMFCNPEKLQTLRRRVKDGDLRKEFAGRVQQARRRFVGGALTPEPPFLKPGPERNVAYKNVFVEIRPPLAAMDECALLYLLTGDRELGTEARRRLLHYAAFDPKGSTNVFHNDEPHMTISDLCVRTYDWIWDLLSAEERAAVEKPLVTRIRDAHELLRKTRFRENPCASHTAHELGIVAQGCLAFAPEHPDLRPCYEYAIDTYRRTFPGFGRDDGGWNEGPSYWTWYAQYHLAYLTEIREATGEDIPARRAYWRNTPYYRVYVTPPGHSLAPFGDGCQGRPFPTSVIRSFAWTLKDPVLLWFWEQQKGTSQAREVYDLVNEVPDMKSQKPAAMPPLRHFPGVGLVCSHTSMTNPADNVSFFFHSNPYGAVSHAHNNQNAFALSAYGEPLLINSGHYNVYGSPHHLQWTRQTKASCCVTYDGGTSQDRGPAAKGRILSCVDTPRYAAFAGECGAAWGGRLARDLREVVRIYPDTFVIRDTVEGTSDHVFEYNLHAKREMKTHGSVVTVENGAAAADVTFLAPAHPDFRQSCGFDPPVTAFRSPAQDEQWHLVARTPSARTGTFVTVVQPYRRGRSAGNPAARLVRSPDADRVTLTWPDGRTAAVVFGNRQGTSPQVTFGASDESGTTMFACFELDRRTELMSPVLVKGPMAPAGCPAGTAETKSSK